MGAEEEGKAAIQNGQIAFEVNLEKMFTLRCPAVMVNVVFSDLHFMIKAHQ